MDTPRIVCPINWPISATIKLTDYFLFMRLVAGVLGQDVIPLICANATS